MPDETQAKDKPKVSFKFPMHGTHMRKSIGILRKACIWALVAPVVFYFLHNVRRKEIYKSYYSTYDPMDAFDRMQRAGYLDSCPVEDKKEKKDGKKDEKKKK
ncbi:CG31644 [Drosophila busckii]|uniref:CG31644 n=1 Tax=Drosophila busckii TaxID=30019 RepID=A0A0M4E642_DROBS|nr:uncharacterized protein LOC108605227 [Drosophila busckii]ALC39734.1 CG31644 [Drosophila busckii]